MRILITGVAGFIGSNLANFLLDEGHEIIGVDNFVTGNKANLKLALQHNKFEFLRHDITFPLYTEVDGIINLACPASPHYYQKDPVQTLKTCFIGSVNLLGMAKRLNIPILQASTSEIYGDPKENPQKENYWGNVNPIGPRSCYDEGKRAAETLFSDYRNQYGVNSKIIRIFNTYGPNMSENDGRVVSNFIVQALKGEKITIYGDGSQTRSFCYITDLIDGINKVFFAQNDGLPINLGNPDEIKIIDLAKEVIFLTNSKSQIEFKKLPQDDPSKRQPDISRAKNLLNWEPKIYRTEGLKKTINYFKGVLQI